MNKSEYKRTAVKISTRVFKGFPILLASFLLITSCYVPPSGTPISEPVMTPPPAPIMNPPAAAVKPPPAPVYLYPKDGRPPGQQDRDRYECYNWATQQTGFDPAFLPPRLRAAIVPAIAGAAPYPAAQERAKQVEEPYSIQDQMLYSQYEKRGMDFRRAMSACLEGRGYSVR